MARWTTDILRVRRWMYCAAAITRAKLARMGERGPATIVERLPVSRAAGLAALVAVAGGFVAYLVLAVPVAATPLGSHHQLLFCPLLAPPVPRGVAMLHWSAAVWSAVAVASVDAAALFVYARRRRRLGPTAT